jgi:hypothetical protein
MDEVASEKAIERTIRPVRRIGCIAALLVALVPAMAAAAPGPRLVASPAHGADDFPEPPASTPAATTRAAGPRRTVTGELAQLLKAGAMTRSEYDHRRATYVDTVRLARRLSGERRYELRGVLADVDGMAARGMLTASRVNLMFLTLERNRAWWANEPLIADRQRVEFPGSRLVWEHYAGHGIQLQMLASFGKANGLWTGHFNGGMRSLLGELLPLAAHRAGGLAWEEDFGFGGGGAGWVSALSQGTAMQALARAGHRFHRSSYLHAAHSALALFSAPPPVGVRQRTRLGARYLIYSFAPGLHVLNAFIQALNGLFDYAKYANDAGARRVFGLGDREARAETPSYDTGAWSLYSPGQESTLSYHELVRDFLTALCARTKAHVYCATAKRFTSYLHEPPRMTLLTHHARQYRPATVRFRLSKFSSVAIEIVRSGHVLLRTGAVLGYGIRAFSWPAAGHAGRYEVRLTARDAAGNKGTTRSILTTVR